MNDLSQPVDQQDHVQGSAEAPVTLVEYGDYECPSCGQAAHIVRRVQKHFGDKLRFVFRNFPLPMHSHAVKAAETAEFAAAGGAYWEMHDLLFAHQSRLDDDSLRNYVEKLGLDGASWNKTIAAGTYKAKLEADTESGEASGVSGTPSFYINGQEFDGSYDYDTLVAAIEAA